MRVCRLILAAVLDGGSLEKGPESRSFLVKGEALEAGIGGAAGVGVYECGEVGLACDDGRNGCWRRDDRFDLAR